MVLAKEIVTGIMIVKEPYIVELIIVGHSMQMDPFGIMMIVVSWNCRKNYGENLRGKFTGKIS